MNNWRCPTLHFKILTYLLLATSVLLTSCTTPTPPEEIAANFIKQSEEAFEDRNILLLRKLISSNYRDARNRNAGDVISIAAAYISRSKSIFLFSDLDSAVYDEKRIQARVLTAFGARPIIDRKALVQLNADIYWFDIVLADEDGNWKLVDARWQQAMIDDFLEVDSRN